MAGCGNNSAPGYLRYSSGTEPETLDPRKSTGLPEANIESQVFEGLTTLNDKDIPVPAVAEKWEVSPDGLTYIFYLRADAKWSTGDPVTAQDFEYAWKTALSPELGSKYAYQLFYLKNGKAYNDNQATADEVGVTAVDSRTLKVTLEEPTAYFLSLTTFHTYYPVHRKTVENNAQWATKPQSIIGNGPFKIINWVHSSKIEFAKNDFYWDSAKVKMTKMTFYLIDNASTELTLFENDQLDMGSNPPTAEIPRLVQEGKLKFLPYLGTYFYCFNVTSPPLDNPKLRQALLLAIDRNAIINNILKGEQKAALAWVPYNLTDIAPGSDFRLTGGDLFKDNDVAAARKLLAEAGYPGGRGLPPITLIYNTSEAHKAIAEAIQEMWKRNLGVNINLTNQEWKVFLDTRSKGDYHIARHGWIGDYSDPMTFLDMFVSDGGNNDARYKNPAYDEQVRRAKSSIDPVVRMQAMHAAEKILIDDAVILPIYFYTNAILIKPSVKGYIRSVLGQLYFKEAYIEQGL